MEQIPQIASLNSPMGEDARGTLVQLLNDARSALPESPGDAEYCISLAAAILAQDDETGSRASGSLNRGGLAPWQARRAEAMIEENLDVKLSVRALAEAVRLSPSHFSRAFRHTFGIAPHGYILRCRIERAKELMRMTNDALADIALACGLTDQSHFSTVFRRIECESPNAWRRRCQGGPDLLS